MNILHLAAIIVPVFFTLFVTSQAYAPCIEGYGINCNGYPSHTLSQIHFDKINYETQDKPVITISGVPSTAVHLEIDDSSSNIMFEHDLTLSSNGTARYILYISSYQSGGYFATATSLMSKVTTGFTVGMTPSGGMMGLNVDKNSYLPGDRISILGTANSNTLIQLSMIDPYGTPIRSAKIFSDKTGHFSLSNFTIPNNAVSGIWQIGATGGVIHVRAQITVNSTNNSSGIKTDKAITSSPLKQFKSGIAANDVKCEQSFQLVIKTEDNSPACVKPQTAQKLVERGWTKIVFETGIAINSYTPISNETENQTVKVVEIKMVPPYTPGGPVIQLTIQNIGTTPIIHLNAILETNHNYTFNFQSITSSTPLISGNSISDTTMLIGGGFQTESTYSLIISGMKDNMPFEYLEKVHIPG